jgi:hypothetical protein
MYNRWSEQKDFKITVTDYQDGEEAGISSASLKIEGPYAYGYLKAERGVIVSFAFRLSIRQEKDTPLSPLSMSHLKLMTPSRSTFPIPMSKYPQPAQAVKVAKM